ncbi:hypothetical protein AAHA92_25174 [Salvia divinorum]|uniref:Uncharacterized protein n=1 Tax=Salvia divinorum TaxID=28513 RepID=A0ABD1G9S1_SALDI
MKIELTAHAHALYSLFSPSSSSPNFPKLTLPKCIIHLDSRLWLLPLCAVNSATPAVAPMLLLIAWGAARHLYLTAEPPSCPRRRAAASLLQRPDVPVRVLPPTAYSFSVPSACAASPPRCCSQRCAARPQVTIIECRLRSRHRNPRRGRPKPLSLLFAVSVARQAHRKPTWKREHAKQHTLGDLGLWWEMECSRFWTPGLELVCQH